MIDDDFVQWQVSGAQAKARTMADSAPLLKKRRGQLKPVSKQELDESIAALASLL